MEDNSVTLRQQSSLVGGLAVVNRAMFERITTKTQAVIYFVEHTRPE